MANIVFQLGAVWPGPVAGYSGRPATNRLARGLWAQQAHLWVGSKYPIQINLQRAAGGGLDWGEIPVGDPGQARIRIPPYTRWLEWAVLGSGAGAFLTQRSGEAWQHRVHIEAGASIDESSAAWYAATTVAATADDEPECIDCGALSAAWQTITIDYWIVPDALHATAYALAFLPLRIDPARSEYIS